MPPRSTAKSIQKLKEQYIKVYGEGAATTGADIPNYGVIPTGSLDLDLALGTGGWVRGCISHVYAPPDIGKTNCIGMGAVRSAQKQGLIPVVIAIEPGFDDPEWMIKHGVNPDEVLVLHPESGEEAVEMAIRNVRSGDCDVLIFDSIGALLNQSEQEDDGKTKAGGQSGLVSRLTKNLGPASGRHRVASIFLNQIRADFAARGPMAANIVKYPGGNTLAHMAAVHVRLRYGKGGKKGMQVKEHGEAVTIGRQVIAIVERNKFREGSDHKAIFDFYIKDTNGEYPFGVDVFSDVMNVGQRFGVVKQAGAYYEFGEGHRIKGKDAAAAHLLTHPELVEDIRVKCLAAQDAAE